MSIWVDEGAFIAALNWRLKGFHKKYAAVTGPGRSGAVAAAFASHLSGRPFVPYGQPHPGPILIVDTAEFTGATLRKARNRYKRLGIKAYVLPIYAAQSPPQRYHFWYEKPVDKLVEESRLDYDWSTGNALFWWRFFPWNGPPPRPTTGCGCSWWLLVLLITILIIW